MPAYLTEAELKSRVGGHEAFLELTDDNGDDVADVEVMDVLQAQLDAELDGYFRAGGYTTPLDTDGFGPAKRAALDLANYRLLTRGVRTPSETDRLLFEDARRFFEGIAGGKILLGTIEESRSAAPVFDSRTPLLTLEKLAGYY